MVKAPSAVYRQKLARSTKPDSPPPLPGAIHVWTDGACSNNGKVGAKAGWGAHFPNAEFGDAYGPQSTGTPTNQRSELEAILRAVSLVPPDKPVHVNTDSMYSINCLTKWIKGWKQNKWKNAAGKDVLNQDLIRAIDSLITSRSAGVRFTHVAGHSGNAHNDKADELARMGARGMRSVPQHHGATIRKAVEHTGNADSLSLDAANPTADVETHVYVATGSQGLKTGCTWAVMCPRRMYTATAYEETTRPRCELIALREALHSLPRDGSIGYIHTESEYAVKTQTEWYSAWALKDFEGIKNADIIKATGAERSAFGAARVKFIFHAPGDLSCRDELDRVRNRAVQLLSECVARS